VNTAKDNSLTEKKRSMLYLENDDSRGKGWARVFSTTDSERELDTFRCLVRAPRHALHEKKDKEDRIYLSLFGAPRESAILMIPHSLVFSTPLERMKWEKEKK